MSLLFTDVLARRRYEKQIEEDARKAALNPWFRPNALALLAKRPVRFTILTDPWDEQGRFTFTCKVSYDGEEKTWEILSDVIQLKLKSIAWKQAEDGMPASVIGWEVEIRWEGVYSHVEFRAPKGETRWLI